MPSLLEAVGGASAERGSAACGALGRGVVRAPLARAGPSRIGSGRTLVCVRAADHVVWGGEPRANRRRAVKRKSLWEF